MPLMINRQPGGPNIIQMAVLNLSMRHLSEWLVTRPIEEIRGWAQSGASMIDMIPPEFEIDKKMLHLDGRIGGWAQRRLLVPNLRIMGPLHWDEMLHLMDDMAQSVLGSTQDEDQIESALYLQQIVGVFLNEEKNGGNPWYYAQMDHLRDMIIAKLEAKTA